MTEQIITVKVSQHGFMADLLKFYRELPETLDFSDRDYRCDITFHDNGNANVAYHNVQTDMPSGYFRIELDLQKKSFTIGRLVSPDNEVEKPLIEDVAIRLVNALDPLNITYELQLDKSYVYKSVEPPLKLYIWVEGVKHEDRRGIIFAMAHDVEQARRAVIRFGHDIHLGDMALDEVVGLVNQPPHLKTGKPTGRFFYERD